MGIAIGDKVRTQDNREGVVKHITTLYGDVIRAIVVIDGQEYEYPRWQLISKVEEPESKWLLTKEQRIAAMDASGQCCRDCGEQIALAAFRLVVEELVIQNDRITQSQTQLRASLKEGCCEGWLLLSPKKWAEMQRAAGL